MTMTTTKDGGPAFPGAEGMWPGMTLRDYFAAKAMHGFCSGPEGGINPVPGMDYDWLQATSRVAYEMADAMLKAREQ